MQKVDLNKVLEMLINEEQNEAQGLLHEWFVEMSKSVHESIMQEDDQLSKDIEDDQEAIKSEEFYSEAEDEEVEGDEEVLDGDVEVGEEDSEKEEEPVEDRVADLEAEMARLKAEFNTIVGLEEPEHGVDINGDGVIGNEDSSVEELEDSEEAEEVEESDEVEESFELLDLEEDFDDLEESFKLEPVADPKLGDKEIGSSGAKVNVNTTSPLPSKKGSDRVGGEAVEIVSDEHDGFDLEPAPEVKAKPLLKNQVKKATDGQSKVSKEGDKSAMLNKKDGFGSDSPNSPIGGGAADLRGSDFKRK